MTDTYVLINDQPYPTDTDDEIAAARMKLAEYGFRVGVVYAGDPECPDSYANGQLLHPAEDALDQLLAQVKDGGREIDDRLPTFGGDDPEDTYGVWSWDKARLMVGTCGADMEIISRGDGS